MTVILMLPVAYTYPNHSVYLLVLVTPNEAEFARVEDLLWENWRPAA